ncbi:Immunogenic protein MPT70 precursor [Poriferisphaera corsica]|uniref:Immunogenic protein MPT70 n=1 Tax=Poriferisphaera corsica TaxID=2528020 RepID=A0A517YP78_9BACT|nr:fasciclin domain-containing protein [Poriferisphaera corsica]QDU32023.1 Immunogenic protein MPT70 precursor [Poriferisphaera corsica]
MANGLRKKYNAMIDARYFWFVVLMMLCMFLGFGVVLFISERAFGESVFEEDGPFLLRERSNVYEVVEEHDRFSVFETLVKHAKLVDELEGEGPMTLFAPTDDAFEDMEKGMLNALFMEKNRGLLVKVIVYHLSPRIFLAADVVNEEELPTIEGEKLVVEIRGDDVYLNGKELVGTDVVTGNGVVHAIDGVLIPRTVLEKLNENDDREKDES